MCVSTSKVRLLEGGEAPACAVGDAEGLGEGSVCFCTIWRTFAPHHLPALQRFKNGLHYSRQDIQLRQSRHQLRISGNPFLP